MQVPLNQIFEVNVKRRQTHSLNPHLNITLENTHSSNFNKVYGSPIRTERSPTSSYDAS